MCIEHLDAECAGSWAPDHPVHAIRWTCRACGAEHPESGVVRIAAVRENLIGALMRLLASQGRLLLLDDPAGGSDVGT